MLECRLTPAVNYWLGGTGDFATAGNWSDGLPTSDDDLIFDGTLSQTQFPNFGVTTSEQTIEGEVPTTPPPTSPPTSPPVFNPNANVTFLSTVGTLFGSIHLRNGYSGTVTIPFDVTFGGFEQTTGAINQDSGSYQTAAHTLSVNAAHATLGSMGGAFSWTGGVLNSGSNAGVVSIVGMTNATMGQKSQTDGSMLSAGSLTTGSTVKLLSGTILESWGSIILNNDVDFIVGELCQHKNPQPPAGTVAGEWQTNIKKGVGTTTNGGITIVRGNDSALGDSNDTPIFIDGGHLTLKDHDCGTTGVFANRPDGTPWEPTNAAVTVSIYLKSGSINITDGKHLKPKPLTYVYVEDGKLTTNTNAATPPEQRVAFIDGALWVVGGEVVIGANDLGATHTYSTLHVSSTIYFWGGTYKPFVDASNANAKDRWTTDQKFFFKTTATIAPVVLNGTVANQNGNGLSWEVIVAINGIGDNLRPGVSVAADWQVLTGTDPNDANAPYRSILVKKTSAN